MNQLAKFVLPALFVTLTLSDSAHGQWWWRQNNYASVLIDQYQATDVATVNWWPLNRFPGVTATDDLEGMTYVPPPYYYWPATGQTFLSGGHRDGGIIYRNNLWGHWWGPPIIPLGWSGYRAVKALAAIRTGWFGNWSLQLFGSATASNQPTDLLIRINPWTGAGSTIGAFGTHAGRKIQDIEGMAIHPFDRPYFLIGVTGFHFDGTPGDVFRIDPTTGQATLLASLVQSGTGLPPVDEITGLTFSDRGQLFGTTRFGSMISINLATGTFQYMGRFTEPGERATDIAFFGGIGRY